MYALDSYSQLNFSDTLKLDVTEQNLRSELILRNWTALHEELQDTFVQIRRVELHDTPSNVYSIVVRRAAKKVHFQ